MCLCLKKRSFSGNNKIFPWLCYSPNEDVSYCLSFVFLVMIFLLKLLGLKIYFQIPSVLFLTLRLIVKAKRRKLIHHMILLKVFVFEHDLNLKLFFLKSKAQIMKFICYVTENINTRLKKTMKY